MFESRVPPVQPWSRLELQVSSSLQLAYLLRNPLMCAHRPSRLYITAESKGSCRALWCGVPGAGGRRVASLGQSSSSINVPAAGPLPTTKTAAAAPVAAKKRAGTLPTREAGDGGSAEGGAHPGHEKAFTTAEDRHARRMKAQAEAAEAAAAAATLAAAKRAAALSAALLEDDDQATSASRAGRKSLFASRNGSTGGLHADGIDGGFRDENENAGEDGRDGEEPVNIAVVSRCRPLLVREMKRGVRAAVFCDGNDIVVSGELLPNKRPRRFGFDRVFGKRLRVLSIRFQSPLYIYDVGS